MNSESMRNELDVFWLRLHSVFASFAERLSILDPELICEIRRTANETYLLRGYLAFTKHAQGDELAITVDIRKDGEQLTIESDVVWDDGVIVAVGPSAAVVVSETRMAVDSLIGKWLDSFERFLMEQESNLGAAASRL